MNNTLCACFEAGHSYVNLQIAIQGASGTPTEDDLEVSLIVQCDVQFKCGHCIHASNTGSILSSNTGSILSSNTGSMQSRFSCVMITNSYPKCMIVWSLWYVIIIAPCMVISHIEQDCIHVCIGYSPRKE